MRIHLDRHLKYICVRERIRFRRLFGDSAEITEANLLRWAKDAYSDSHEYAEDPASRLVIATNRLQTHILYCVCGRITSGYYSRAISRIEVFRARKSKSYKRYHYKRLARSKAELGATIAEILHAAEKLDAHRNRILRRPRR